MCFYFALLSRLHIQDKRKESKPNLKKNYLKKCSHLQTCMIVWNTKGMFKMIFPIQSNHKLPNSKKDHKNEAERHWYQWLLCVMTKCDTHPKSLNRSVNNNLNVILFLTLAIIRHLKTCNMLHMLHEGEQIITKLYFGVIYPFKSANRKRRLTILHFTYLLFYKYIYKSMWERIMATFTVGSNNTHWKSGIETLI